MPPVCSTSKSSKFEERSHSHQNTIIERDLYGATTASNTDTGGLTANALKSVRNVLGTTEDKNALPSKKNAERVEANIKPLITNALSG
jgi:hypothetical protein